MVVVRMNLSLELPFKIYSTTTVKLAIFLLIPELPYKNQRIIPDGTIKDALQLDWGYWESKDENDDLDLEIEKKNLLKAILTIIFYLKIHTPLY